MQLLKHLMHLHKIGLERIRISLRLAVLRAEADRNSVVLFDSRQFWIFLGKGEGKTHLYDVPAPKSVRHDAAKAKEAQARIAAVGGAQRRVSQPRIPRILENLRNPRLNPRHNLTIIRLLPLPSSRRPNTRNGPRRKRPLPLPLLSKAVHRVQDPVLTEALGAGFG